MEEERRPLPKPSEAVAFAARQNRIGCTEAESLLWSCLRSRQLHGRKFRRQHPIGRFIADFYCDDARLIVEIDGGYHDEAGQRERDEERAKILEAYALNVLRFSNSEVLSDIEPVIQTIGEYVLEHTYERGGKEQNSE